VKTILIFQGGGALGAYECGAFQAIAAHIDKQRDDVMAVGGTSIGALNASIIASAYQRVKNAKEAAEALKRFCTCTGHEYYEKGNTPLTKNFV